MSTIPRFSSPRKKEKSSGNIFGVVPIHCSDPEGALAVSDLFDAKRFSRIREGADTPRSYGLSIILLMGTTAPVSSYEKKKKNSRRIFGVVPIHSSDPEDAMPCQ